MQHLTEFERSIGVTFKHIRILAKAFTRKCVGFNNLTLYGNILIYFFMFAFRVYKFDFELLIFVLIFFSGHNQRLEFLGDTVLQLITTDYLYKHFPYHHEGHLSILRTCVVSNKVASFLRKFFNNFKHLIELYSIS